MAGARGSGCGIRFYLVVILALDTTTRAGSVAVLEDDTVVSSVPGDGNAHTRRAPARGDGTSASIRQAEPARHRAAGVASGQGPSQGCASGSPPFKAWPWCSTRPSIGVSALDALAVATWPQLPSRRRPRCAAWMDAQRGEVFAAPLRTRRR